MKKLYLLPAIGIGLVFFGFFSLSKANATQTYLYTGSFPTETHTINGRILTIDGTNQLHYNNGGSVQYRNGGSSYATATSGVSYSDFYSDGVSNTWNSKESLHNGSSPGSNAPICQYATIGNLGSDINILVNNSNPTDIRGCSGFIFSGHGDVPPNDGFHWLTSTDTLAPFGNCIDGIQNQDETSIDYGGVCGFRTNGCEQQGIVLYDAATNYTFLNTFSGSDSEQYFAQSGSEMGIFFRDLSYQVSDELIIQNYGQNTVFNTGSFQVTSGGPTTIIGGPKYTETSLNQYPKIVYSGTRVGQQAPLNYIRFKTNATAGIQYGGKQDVVGLVQFFGPSGTSFSSLLTLSGGYATAVAQQRGTETVKYYGVTASLFQDFQIQGFEIGFSPKITGNTFNCSNNKYVCSFKPDNAGQNVYCGSTSFDVHGVDLGSCTSQNGSGSIITDKYTGQQTTIGSGSVVCTTSSDPTAIPSIPGNTSLGYTTDSSGNVVISDPTVANPLVPGDCNITGWGDALSCAYEKVTSFIGMSSDSANSVGKIANTTTQIGKATHSGSTSWSLGTGSGNGDVPILSTMMNKYDNMAAGNEQVLSSEFLALKWFGIAIAVIGIVVLFISLLSGD